LGGAEIEAFLTHLPVDEQVAASTQNQALSALLFLYAQVLGLPIDAPLRAVRAKQPERLPTVLTRDEVRSLLSAITGVHQLMAKVLGMPGYPFSTIEHPVSSATDEELKARARTALEQGCKLLLQ